MRVGYETLDFYVRFITQQIIDKYNFTEMQAIQKFVLSETYLLLNEVELELYNTGPMIVFDMWECEQICGDPRQTIYFRSDG